MEHNDNSIKILQEKYKKKLTEKIEAIEAEWYSLRNGWNKEKMQVFLKLVHNFHGSAGSYDFSEISQALDELEVYLRECIKEDKPLSKPQEEKIGMLVIKVKAF